MTLPVAVPTANLLQQLRAAKPHAIAHDAAWLYDPHCQANVAEVSNHFVQGRWSSRCPCNSTLQCSRQTNFTQKENVDTTWHLNSAHAKRLSTGASKALQSHCECGWQSHRICAGQSYRRCDWAKSPQMRLGKATADAVGQAAISCGLLQKTTCRMEIIRTATVCNCQESAIRGCFVSFHRKCSPTTNYKLKHTAWSQTPVNASK